jgi:phenylpropionate dioxygenase-like ring-hydroxylating dioxygenase large terminal subunit
MLDKEENDLVTRTDPGTPMGNLFRQFWLPALLSSELPSADCDPVRVMLLGEQLIAFRDTTGQVGLIHNNCPHRGASLFFGRNEESGLRCVYHGWKFATDGACVDMPNEPSESDFKSKVHAVAYPCRERNGVVWAYLGPRETPPPLPDLEPNMLPDGRYWVYALQRECNWLQAVEGDFDTSHASFLHSGSVQTRDTTPGTFGYYMARNRAPKYLVVDTPAGVMYTGYRDAEPGFTYHRIAQFLLPACSMTPTNVMGKRVFNSFSVPMDDAHMLRFYFGQIDEEDLEAGRSTDEIACRFLNRGYPFQFAPSGTGWFDRFRLVDQESNDWFVDRDLQRRNDEYSGLRGTVIQDQAITISEGPIYDRSIEHLGTSDACIIRIRRRLINAATALATTGALPTGVDDATVWAVRSGGVILPSETDWVTGTEVLRKAFVEHPELEADNAREQRARRLV